MVRPIPTIIDLDKDIQNGIRIVHISDLHFGKESDEIADTFDAFNDWLLRNIPHFIVITGDIAEWGKKGHFNKAKSFIDGLKAQGIKVVLAPGNHDTYQFYYLPFPSRIKKYKTILGTQPYFCLYCRTPSEINVTFFVFNSTAIFPLEFWGISRGRIGKEQLKYFESSIEYLNSYYGPSYVRSLKIAVMHHHLIPTKKKSGSTKDNFTYLINSGEVLQFLKDNAIDMVLHGHEHISANYFLIADQECGTADQDESSLVFQAGTLSRGGKINEPIDSYISFYRYEVREETISIGQFNFRNNPRSFIGCCEIITKRNRRKYYRFSVNETWEIDKFLNNKGRREIICRAWQGQKVETIEQVIGSTIPANFEDIDFKPERKDGNIEVIDVKGKKPFDLKHITLKLTPPMLDSCDDVITLSYKWDKDFMELSTGRIESVYWYPKRLDSYGLTIQGHINIEASEIYCEGKHIFKREEDKMVFSVENLRPGKRIHFVLVAKE